MGPASSEFTNCLLPLMTVARPKILPSSIFGSHFRIRGNNFWFQHLLFFLKQDSCIDSYVGFFKALKKMVQVYSNWSRLGPAGFPHNLRLFLLAVKTCTAFQSFNKDWQRLFSEVFGITYLVYIVCKLYRHSFKIEFLETFLFGCLRSGRWGSCFLLLRTIQSVNH